eukprot:Lankesteria_metandrocarpae@DN4394_c0_g1_i1.p1
MTATGGPEWHLLESAPEVFTELCDALGTKNVEFKEVYGTDPDSFNLLRSQVRGHILGFVFLFKWEKGGNPPRPSTGTDADISGQTKQPVFFAQQLVPNACATYAILNILLNSKPSADPRLGDSLENFKTFSQELDSYTMGMAVAGNETLRKAHNAFKASSPLDYVSLSDAQHKGEDAFHYVAYAFTAEGQLIELDGLEQQHFVLTSCEEPESELEAARIAIGNRIRHVQSLSSTANNGNEDEIRFSLMAVTSNQSLQLAKELALQLEYRKLIENKTKASNVVTGDTAGTDADSTEHSLSANNYLAPLTEDDRVEAVTNAAQLELPDTTALLDTLKTEIDSKILNLEMSLSQELATRRRARHDNVLRRSNYFPVVLRVLKYVV